MFKLYSSKSAIGFSMENFSLESTSLAATRWSIATIRSKIATWRKTGHRLDSAATQSNPLDGLQNLLGTLGSHLYKADRGQNLNSADDGSWNSRFVGDTSHKVPRRNSGVVPDIELDPDTRLVDARCRSTGRAIVPDDSRGLVIRGGPSSRFAHVADDHRRIAHAGPTLWTRVVFSNSFRGANAFTRQQMHERRHDLARSVSRFDQVFQQLILRFEFARLNRVVQRFDKPVGVLLFQFFQSWHGKAWNLGFREPNDLLQATKFATADQADRFTTFPRATRPANAMDVVFGVVRQFIIENDLKIVDVQTSRGDIGGDQ